tara:strand:- start:959 stop:3121 length:2163 start_codon:yes stop_codon:yes gene_type:complete
MKNVKYFVILFFVICSCQEIELLDHSNPLDDGRPFVSTIKSDLITSKTAELHGEIVSSGISEITFIGHCYSTSSNPTVNNMYKQVDELDSFISFVSDLTPETKYYFRAFAANNIDTGYGEILSFTTNELGEPTVLTVNSSNITSTSVDFEGNITDEGLDNVSQHGHCWSITTNPSINNSKTNLGNGNIGTYISNVSSLNQNTIYFYRAYATNSYGTVYGAQQQFSTTNGEPTVITISSSNVTASSVNLNGEIAGIGDAGITQHGHCWSSIANPTINNSKTSLGNGTNGPYTSNIVTLSQNTTYYYRAYATNSFGTAYGNQMQFNTSNGEANVVTGSYNNITSSTVDLVGQITDIGDASVTQHGHCWSINNNPTINNSKTNLGSSNIGSFTSNVTNLIANTIYYYRAYATNTFGTTYGSQKSITTAGLWSSIGNISTATIDNNNSMLVLAEDNVWLAGSEMHNWNGSSWSTISTHASLQTIKAVHGTSSSNIWIIDNQDEIWNWNGSTWTEYTPSISGWYGGFDDILVFNNTVIVGGTRNFGPGLLISTNFGTSWTQEYNCTSGNCAGFSDMDGTNASNIWVAAGSTSGVTGTSTFNGLSWGPDEYMYNIRCLSVINSSSAFATSVPDAGFWYPTIKEYSSQNGWGNTITRPSGMSANAGYTPIDAVSSNEVWFGSDKIYKYNGSSWTEETGAISSGINIIQMLDNNIGYAVTGNGTILKR